MLMDGEPSSVTGSSKVSKFGRLSESHFELRIRHAWAMPFASLLVLSEDERGLLFLQSVSIRRS